MNERRAEIAIAGRRCAGCKFFVTGKPCGNKGLLARNSSALFSVLFKHQIKRVICQTQSFTVALFIPYSRSLLAIAV